MRGAWAISHGLNQAVDFARRRPGGVLACVLATHLVVWTAVPALVCYNLQLDLVEDLALGREWQVGYWKHPPLPWWTADLIYRLSGSLDALYLLGPLAVVVCLYGVWRMAHEVVDGFDALISVLALEGLHFYNYSAVKFAHDQMQLPFWAFTALFFYRALVRGRTLDWILAGAFLAGAFWSKYAVIALAATLGLFLLFDKVARRAWRSPGPYLMGLAFAIVAAPNAWWLVTHDFLPVVYVDERAMGATQWYQYATYPLRWIVNNALALAPAGVLLALLFSGGGKRRPATDEQAAFNRRYVTTLALGPFLVTTLAAIAFGRLAVPLWGYPLWSFAPLAALMWLDPVRDAQRLRAFAVAFMALFVLLPVGYAAYEFGEPFFRDRPKATQFPGRLLADMLTQEWREWTGTPLRYIGGASLTVQIDGVERASPGPGEFAANNVAVYSPDHPHVVVHGDPSLSPWIDRADLRRYGMVLVWTTPAGSALPANLRALYPNVQQRPSLVLPRHTLRKGRTQLIHYAIVPPQP